MARTSTRTTRPAPSIGARLERDRLEGRARRLERVVDALRARAHDHAAQGAHVPLGLASSLDDFQRELGAVRRVLQRTDDPAGA